jgi:hypothetical protein
MALVSLLVVVGLLEIATRILVPAVAFRVLPNIFARDPDPRVGYTMRHGYTSFAFGVPLETNSLGFRGPEWGTTKPEGALRIALIGDSHAFGHGVPFEQTMGERLARRLQVSLGRAVEVMNFGVNGYNARQELAVLESKALPLVPDLVLLLPCNNDDESPVWADSDGFLRWGSDGDQSGSDNISWDRFQQRFASFQKQLFGASRFLLWLRLQWLHYSMARAADEVEVARGIPAAKGWLPPAGVGPVDEKLRAPVVEPLAAMIDLARAGGARVALLTFMAPLNWRQTLNTVAAEKHVPLLELIPLLDGAESWRDVLEKWSLGWDAHMAGPAQDVWADGVAQFLLQNGLVSRPPTPPRAEARRAATSSRRRSHELDRHPEPIRRSLRAAIHRSSWLAG